MMFQNLMKFPNKMSLPSKNNRQKINSNKCYQSIY